MTSSLSARLTPSATLCEGRLQNPALGWTLCGSFPARIRGSRTRRTEHKTAALLRALELTAIPTCQNRPCSDIAFPAGSAPVLAAAPVAEPASAIGARREPTASAAASPTAMLSLAHSGSLLLAAAGEPTQRLGVDIEQIRLRDFDRIGSHMGWRPSEYFVSDTRCGLSEELLFYRRWTLAESLYKALGSVNLECFAELEPLILGDLEGGDLEGKATSAGWDSGWCGKIIGKRRWWVRWWRVAALEQSALACVLRGTEL